jgi:hypothetical protein
MKRNSAIISNHTNQQAHTKVPTHAIPVVVNGLTSLDASTKNVRRTPNSSVRQKEKHKIIIIGCAGNVNHNLNGSYRYSGFVRPGANIGTQTSSMTEDTQRLTNNDAIVFWGGANDVSKNNSQDGLKHITNFVKRNSHTNVNMSVPHGHDLPEWSCVNNEVKYFIRNSNKMALFITLLYYFVSNALHVSDTSRVHHQEPSQL